MTRTLVIGTLIALASGTSIATAAEQRKWSDVSGRFSVSAELVEVSGSTVRLRKADGTEVSLDLKRLCTDDQDYIRNKMPESADAKSPPSGKTPSDGMRIWKDDTGTFSVEAEFVEQSAKEVRLRKTDGSVVSVPIDRLGAEDRAILRKKKDLKAGRPSPTGLESILRTSCSIDVADTPLTEVLLQLHKRNGLKFFIDLKSLQNFGIWERRPVTYKATNCQLDVALRGMLEPLELSFYDLYNEALVVCAKREDDGEFFVWPKVYRITLDGSKPIGAVDYDTLIEQITERIDPDSWDAVGGAGTIQPYRFPVPMLIISNSYWNHRAIEQNFPQLWSVYSTPLSRDFGIGLPERFLKPATFSVSGMKLDEFAKYLSNTFGVTVELDSGALTAAHIPLDTTVTTTSTDVQLITALEFILDQIKCSWSLTENGTVQITSKSINRIIQRDYPIGALVQSPRAKRSDFDWLIRDIKETRIGTHPFCGWRGGTGRYDGTADITPKGVDTITVRQTAPGHLALARLLTDMVAAGAR